MAKLKKRIGYILRITTHKDLKGEHLSIKNRTVRERRTKEKLSLTIRNPKNPAEILQKYKRAITSYTSEYHEGDVVRYSKVFYLKNESEVEKILTRERKLFKRTRKTDFSAVGQVYQGKVKEGKGRFRGVLRYGAKVSSSARFRAMLKRESQANFSNREKDFGNDLRQLEIYYTIKKSKKKVKKFSVLPVTERKKKGRQIFMTLSDKERAASERREKRFKPTAPTATGRRIMRERVLRLNRKGRKK